MIEAELYSHLKDNVLDVGGRIYPLIMPQNCVKPSLVYTVINDADKQSVNGCDIGTNVRIQIDVYALSYASMKAITAEVKSAIKSLDYPRGLNSRDGFDSEDALFRQIIDFTYRRKS